MGNLIILALLIVPDGLSFSLSTGDLTEPYKIPHFRQEATPHFIGDLALQVDGDGILVSPIRPSDIFGLRFLEELRYKAP